MGGILSVLIFTTTPRELFLSPCHVTKVHAKRYSRLDCGTIFMVSRFNYNFIITRCSQAPGVKRHDVSETHVSNSFRHVHWVGQHTQCSRVSAAYDLAMFSRLPTRFPAKRMHLLNRQHPQSIAYRSMKSGWEKALMECS